MRIATTFLNVVFVFLLSFSVINAATNKETLARQAVSSNSTESNAAISELREMKQDGLNALFETYADELKGFSETGEGGENWRGIANAIDSVAQQKDAYASRLYWFTDFEKAKKLSKETNKPILSLRLLGNLNEEFSCANSRFFRSVLYSNAEISKYLHENYVLHWKSVRPAPKVTIDFGDGRKIERTLTGNSIHYILDRNGVVVDALPGLYSPQRFLSFLSITNVVARQNTLAVIEGDKFAIDLNKNFLQDYRAREYRTLLNRINTVGNQVGLTFDKTKKANREFEEMPPAMVAAALAMTKSIVEVGILKNFAPDLTQYGGEQINLEQWKKIAALSKTEAKLDEKSIAFIRNQTAKNDLTKEQFEKLLQNLESYISIDTARNEFLMRPSLLVWLNKGFDKNVEKLNEKVYAELFLTPNEDKWLGLYSTDIYTALDGNGIIK